MLCWSCGKEIPGDAIRCRHCEADMLAKPTGEDIALVEGMLGDMSPDVRSVIQNAFAESKTGEEFVNRIMVGSCPMCDSSNTGDCENDEEIENPCVGRCFDCGQLWCLDCDNLLPKDGSTDCDCELEELWDSSSKMSRIHLLAAEIFGYSFANYENHLGIEHERFESLMPNDAKLLERAHRDHWPVAKVAKSLSIDKEIAKQLMLTCEHALQVVDAENSAESFRNSIRFVIQTAITEGLGDEKSIEDLVTQICYRASDLSVLLELEEKTLSDYSEQLRREHDVK